MAVVVVGVRVAVHEVPTGSELRSVEAGLRRVEDRRPGIRAGQIGVVLVSDARVEHRHHRRRCAGEQQRGIARGAAGREVPGLGKSRAAEEDPIRLRGGDPGRSAQSVQRLLERNAHRQLHQVEHGLAGGGERRSDESQRIRARERKRRIAAHDDLPGRDDLRQAVDHLRDARYRASRRGQCEGGDDRENGGCPGYTDHGGKVTAIFQPDSPLRKSKYLPIRQISKRKHKRGVRTTGLVRSGGSAVAPVPRMGRRRLPRCARHPVPLQL